MAVIVAEMRGTMGRPRRHGDRIDGDQQTKKMGRARRADGTFISHWPIVFFFFVDKQTEDSDRLVSCALSLGRGVSCPVVKASSAGAENKLNKVSAVGDLRGERETN